MWYFRMTREERAKHHTCSNADCNEYGIYSPDFLRSWYCSKHMERKNDRPNKS